MENSTDLSHTPLVVRIAPVNGRVDLPKNVFLKFWLESSLQRVYPQSVPKGGKSIELISARGARLSFQACVNNQGVVPANVELSIESDDGLGITVRRVGWVPQHYRTDYTSPDELDGLEHVPGLVPDPLFPEKKAKVGPYANQSFWVTVEVPADLEPGLYPLKVKFKCAMLGEEVVLTAKLDVRALVIKPRVNFPVTHWWYPECLYDYYELDPLGDEFFEIARPYLRNMVEHGSDVIFIPLLNYRKEFMKRPPQLLKVWETEPGVYRFDWRLVRRTIAMAKELGFKYFEWSHFWAYSHSKQHAASASTPTRIYTERNGKLESLFPEDLDATGEVFNRYMTQFLPEFKSFLDEEGILEQSLFHICDEPTDDPRDVQNYRRARAFLNQIDPSIKVMDAVLGYAYLEPGLMDYPVPIADRAVEFLQKGIPHWTYYCCGPTGSYMNRFLDTPLAKIRAQGWVFYRLRTLGFLHWGFNYWYVQNADASKQEYDAEISQLLCDPFNDASSGQVFAYGDPFVVYPGKDGPIDSIRWEVFAESLQDYALLQTLEITPDDPLLKPIVDYARFPKSEEWIRDAVYTLLAKTVKEA